MAKVGAIFASVVAGDGTGLDESDFAIVTTETVKERILSLEICNLSDAGIA